MNEGAGSGANIFRAVGGSTLSFIREAGAMTIFFAKSLAYIVLPAPQP